MAMPSIRILDATTVNKIAAGEVIDRPASVVKELIENSLDAGADHIHITIEAGGRDRITVADNGRGMDKEDLRLAPMRHTTSKISTIDDLYNAATFGFRGEALASMAHAGRLSIISRPANQPAYKVTAEPEHISEPVPVSHPAGTTIQLDSLFHHIPVRRKFLKSNATETSYIYDIVLQFALLFPEKSFILSSDGQEMLNSGGISDQKALLISFFGKELHEHLVPVQTQIGQVGYSGFVSAPTKTFANRAKQFAAVNGRVVRSGIVSKAVSTAFQDLIPPRRFPLVLLNITIDLQDVDVNIHPQKMDVKFVDPGLIFNTLPKAVKLSLDQHKTGLEEVISHGSPVYDATRRFSPWSEPVPGERAWERPGDEKEPLFQPFTYQYPSPASISGRVSEAAQGFYAPLSSGAAGDAGLGGRSASLEYLHILDTYIIVKGPDGVWLLDQHAVHERVLYEKIKDNARLERETQHLLVSEVLELSPALYRVFEEEQARLAELGFKAEPFGLNQVVIRELPAAFSGIPAGAWLKDYLELCLAVPGQEQDLVADRKEVLQQRACKAAIKAGKKMAPAEVEQLIIDLLRSPSKFSCPHGRPLFIKLGKAELEKMFLRR